MPIVTVVPRTGQTPVRGTYLIRVSVDVYLALRAAAAKRRLTPSKLLARALARGRL